MLLRMRDAGLLRDNAPQPVPQSASQGSSEQPVNYMSSTSQAVDTGMDLFEQSHAIPDLDSRHTEPQAGPVNHQFITQSLPLGYNVPEKTKQLIWSGQYVDVNALTPGASQVTETVLYQSEDASFKLATGLKPIKHIASIHQWNNGFDIYMSIFIKKYPTMATQLLKYANMIRNMSAKIGFESARFYDEEFRKLRATHALNWLVVHDELWRTASGLQVRSQFAQRPRGKQPFRRDGQQVFTKGYCWRFCRTGQCTNRLCKLRHACCICQKRRATGACRKPSKTPNAN